MARVHHQERGIARGARLLDGRDELGRFREQPGRRKQVDGPAARLGIARAEAALAGAQRLHERPGAVARGRLLQDLRQRRELPRLKFGGGRVRQRKHLLRQQPLVAPVQ